MPRRLVQSAHILEGYSRASKVIKSPTPSFQIRMRSSSGLPYSFPGKSRMTHLQKKNRKIREISVASNHDFCRGNKPLPVSGDCPGNRMAFTLYCKRMLAHHEQPNCSCLNLGSLPTAYRSKKDDSRGSSIVEDATRQLIIRTLNPDFSFDERPHMISVYQSQV